MDRYLDRAEAGRLLGTALLDRVPADALLLGLPRGGAVVAAAAAAVTGLDWDVWLVRKLGHPAAPELALGALAEEGDPVWDEHAPPVDDEVRRSVVDHERGELARRRTLYRGEGAAPVVAGRVVVVVDDGLATGSTARAACRSVRAAGARRVVLAAPVGSRDAASALAAEADEVLVLLTPESFLAVGSWYVDFGQTSDAEVLRLLAAR